MPNITANTIGTVGTSTHTTSLLEQKQQVTLCILLLLKLNCNPIKLSDSMVRAVVVAARAHIAFPSDVASFLKAAEAKNDVHIMLTVGFSTQSVKPGSMSTYSELPHNVHILRSSSVAMTPL
ncbi:hypothetical protein ACFX15_039795 [Malus domestica]